MKPDLVYQKLGEVVVCFQWLENRLHQIAWVLIDPDWKTDPRLHTAELWFGKLLRYVTGLYRGYIDGHEVDEPEKYKREFDGLAERCRHIADKRNRIVHSAFVELEAGGDLRGILRSHLKVDVHDKGEKQLSFDQEHLDEHSFDALIKEIGAVGLRLGTVHRQLIHWHGRLKAK